MKLLKSNTLVAQIVLAISAIGTIWGYYTYGVTLGTLLLPILGYFLYVGLGFHGCWLRYGTLRTVPSPFP